jgi:hypothetical protein
MADRTDLTLRNDPYAIVPSNSDDDPDTIRRQIDYTRAQMTTTINEIGERLSPDNLIQQAKTSVREATVGRMKDMSYQANRKMEGMSAGLGQTVRDNPLPVALIGLGLGWLILADRSKRDEVRMSEYPYRTAGYRYYESDYGRGEEPMLDEARRRAGHTVENVQDRAAEMGEGISERASELGGRISGTAHRVSESVSEGAGMVQDRAAQLGSRISDTTHQVGETVTERAEMLQSRVSDAAMRTRSEAERLSQEARWRAQAGIEQTRQTFWQTMEQNPLALGAVVLIAGAAIGAAIPSTEYENRLMGEQRDRLIDEAKTRAQDVVGRVQTAVEETQQAVMTEARSAAERANLPIGDTSGMGG